MFFHVVVRRIQILCYPPKSKLMDPASVGSCDGNHVVIYKHLLADARQVPDPADNDNVSANRRYILICPPETGQVMHLMDGQGAVDHELIRAETLELRALPAKLIRHMTDHLGDDVLWAQVRPERYAGL
jgi:hypothetical protein